MTNVLLNPFRFGVAAFSPADIAGLSMWLKADSLALADAAAVSSWTDSSGVGNTVTQATGTKQPSFRTNVLNALPVVRFDGGDHLAGPITRTLVHTAFLVAKCTTAGNQYIVDGSTINKAMINITGGQATLRMHNGASLDKSGLTLTNWNVIACVFNGATSRNIVGGSVTTGDAGSGALPAGIVIGVAADLAQQWYSGDLAEVIYYDTALSDANLNLVGNYLKAKYALTWTNI